MSLTRFPHGVSSFGLPIVGSGPVFTTGTVFFVSSVTGSSANDGLSPDYPFATIDFAIGNCTANQGDHIVVMPGHVETVTTTNVLVCDVAGITIVGMGYGASRPKVNLTATASVVTISAASVTINNILFTGGIDAIVTPIVISGADCILEGIETRDVTGQATDFITTTAAADRLTIRNWVHRGATAAGADTAISIVGGDGISIQDFSIFGNFAVAAIENVTTACTNITIGGGSGMNYIQNGLDSATPVALTMVATSTGHIGPNINARIGLDATSNTTNITEAFVGAAMQFFQPINIANLGGEVGMQTNITATTDA